MFSYFKRTRREVRNLVKTVRRSLVYCLTIILRTGIFVFSLSAARKLTGLLGVIVFSLFRSERKKTLKNLELAYGEALTKSEKIALGRAVFRNAAMSFAEIVFLHWGRGGNILTTAKVEGIEHVLNVLKTGRGVLVVTAHFGNWELIPPLVGARIPCKGGVVARNLSNPGFNRTILRFRRRFGIHIFRRGETGRDYIHFLREKNVLGILGDIDTTRGNGIFVDFFGRPVWTQRGIAQLALMSNARIIPAFITREPNDPRLHLLKIQPPLDEPQGLKKDEWIATMTQAFTRSIETAVRERPDQWMWMHRRWRHIPRQGGNGPKVRQSRQN